VLGQLREHLQRFKPQSASVRNVLKLAGGTAGSQVITVAAAPILTRLYGPESFGVLATFASILALLNVVSSLRYELAIAVAEDDDEAIALVWLCFVLVAISTALTALGVALLGNHLVGLLDQPALKPLLWLLPVGVLLTGVYQPLSYWAIRRKQFGLLAQTKFRQSIFGVATNLVAAPLGTIGLLLGQIVSQSSGVKSLFIDIPRPSKFITVAAKSFISYRDLGAPSVLAGLINTAGSQMPVLLIAGYYGASDLGVLNVTQRLSLLPASLVATSTSQVFLQRIAAAQSTSEVKILFKLATNRLCRLGVFFCLSIAASSPFLPIILGKEWVRGSLILLYLTPLLFAQIALVPLGVAFEARRKMREGIAAQLLLNLFKVLPLLILLSLFKSNFSVAVLIYSLGAGLGYLIYFLILKTALEDSPSM
jgi:O-antigen/teichoic acid export membrane protein